MTIDDSRWWKAVIRVEETWALVEMRAKSMEDFRLKLRRLINGGVKICNIEEI